MSSGTRKAFDAFIAFASAALPDDVVAHGISEGDAGGPVTCRPVALDRVNRSRRAGPVLDLSLTIEVTCVGPAALDHLEALLVAVELSEAHTLLPRTAPAAPLDPGDLTARVGVPVAVELDVPSGPPITTAPNITMARGRRLRGRVEQPSGHPLSGALVRAATSGATALTDADGVFRMLSDAASPQVFTVQWGGTSCDVTADPQDDPLVLLCATSP